MTCKANVFTVYDYIPSRQARWAFQVELEGTDDLQTTPRLLPPYKPLQRTVAGLASTPTYTPAAKYAFPFWGPGEVSQVKNGLPPKA